MLQSATRSPQPATRLAPLLVVSGPSGVGKTTVVERLIAGTDLPVRRVVTATTREPRPGEADGRDYHFWSPERFREAVDAGAMLEHAVYGGNLYGTPRAEVDPYRAAGVGVILVIDVQGAAQVRGRLPGEHCSVFLRPPSWDELEARLRSRATEDEARLARRLETARRELARAGEFDRQLVNGVLEETVRELAAVVREQFEKRGLLCSTT
jgi:guanylate kinase